MILLIDDLTNAFAIVQFVLYAAALVFMREAIFGNIWMRELRLQVDNKLVEIDSLSMIVQMNTARARAVRRVMGHPVDGLDQNDLPTPRRRHVWWRELSYILGCRSCQGFWIALIWLVLVHGWIMAALPTACAYVVICAFLDVRSWKSPCEKPRSSNSHNENGGCSEKEEVANVK